MSYIWADEQANPTDAVGVYLLFILAVVLICIAARRKDLPDPIPLETEIWDMDGWEILSYIGMWCIILSLIFAGLIDVMIWASKSKSPSVSDVIHYHLQMYPWIGWIAAGLVYHLLVDRPAPPWR